MASPPDTSTQRRLLADFIRFMAAAEKGDVLIIEAGGVMDDGQRKAYVKAFIRGERETLTVK